MLIFLSMIETEEEKDKFVQIYEKYSHFMWYVANEVLWDNYLAEDAVQEAFLALTRHLHKIDCVDSPKTKKFLMTIAKSKAIDIIRKKKGDLLEDMDIASIQENNTEDLLNEYIAKESHESLLISITKLEDIYRLVFEYKYLHQLSDKEIADILGVTQKTVNVRIFRARKKLQEILAKGER
ncbi:MAG: RNA polymerase sigma factor [Velocimicrobium sp.]